MQLTTNGLSLLCCLLLSLGSFDSAPANGRATILYDAFGNSKNVEKDWGFSVLIEYSGKKILFDTGNNSEIFAANVKALNVGLKDLDFVVISHRHGDHTSGLEPSLAGQSEGKNLRSSGIVWRLWKHASQRFLQDCRRLAAEHALFRR